MAVIRDELTGGGIPSLKRGAQLLVVVVLNNPPHAETSDLGGGRTLLSANLMVLPGPPTRRLCLCNGLCFLPSAPSPLASILLSTRSSRARPPTISIVNQLFFFTSLPPPPTHPGRGNPTPRDGESALDYVAFGVIVRNAGLAVVATDARAPPRTVATYAAAPHHGGQNHKLKILITVIPSGNTLPPAPTRTWGIVTVRSCA